MGHYGRRQAANGRRAALPARPGSHFVPSFSILRLAEAMPAGAAWTMQHNVGRALKGRHFWVTPPGELAFKAVPQHELVQEARRVEADIRPAAMRELVYDIRGMLAAQLEGSPQGMAVPLGRLGLFGSGRNVLGVEPLGWRGHGARYATHDRAGELLPVGELAVESQIALDAVARFMGGVVPEFDVRKLLRTPHASLCRRSTAIPPADFDTAKSRLVPIVSSDLPVGDPVILFRAAPNASTEVIPVRTPQMVGA